jgi:hypothetical protein
MVRFGDFPEAPGALLGDMAIGFLADILADAGRAFNGDIRAAALFVLLVRATRSHGPVTNGSHAPGLSQSQLAAISGIPRETVRRKLSAMERQGWVQRHGTMWSLDCDTAQPDTALRMMILEERLRARVARFLDEAAAHWG